MILGGGLHSTKEYNNRKEQKIKTNFDFFQATFKYLITFFVVIKRAVNYPDHNNT